VTERGVEGRERRQAVPSPSRTASSRPGEGGVEVLAPQGDDAVATTGLVANSAGPFVGLAIGALVGGFLLDRVPGVRGELCVAHRHHGAAR